MAPLRTLALLCGAGMASAFAPVAPAAAFARPVTSLNSDAYDGMAESAKQFEAEYPSFAQYGWGPSVHAEVWNGRHAMFGWVFMCATAYAKGHGLIPDADTILSFKEWGTLATISGKNTITNERAIILIANVHCFMVGLMATLCPSEFADPLLLDPNAPGYDRAMERNSKPYGVLPAFEWGLTPEAEIYNGRMAMMGIVTVVSYSFITNTPILDVINNWLGGAYY